MVDGPGFYWAKFDENDAWDVVKVLYHHEGSQHWADVYAIGSAMEITLDIITKWGPKIKPPKE